MSLPVVQGVIRRRILVNFRVDPDVLQRQLPHPFRPKRLDGAAIAGICLIRLEQMRPACVPAPLGLTSENAAHRMAVCWTDAQGQERERVYIPRRDTGSTLHQIAGGHLFTGVYRPARFRVEDAGERIDFRMHSADGRASIELRARISERLPAASRFPSLEAASAFFRSGALGYSEGARAGQLDGMRLETDDWRVTPLTVEHVHSSYFSDATRFPPGSVELDSALLMRDIPHRWASEPAHSLTGA